MKNGLRKGFSRGSNLARAMLSWAVICAVVVVSLIMGPTKAFSLNVGDITTVVGNGIYHPYGMAVDSAGNMFIADYGNHRIRKVDTSGVITTVAGTGVAGYSGDGGPATYANLNYPCGVSIDSSGNLYIVDYLNHRIRKINTSGIITTVAGTGVAGYSGDGGPATAAKLNYANGIAVDSMGNLFIADTNNHRIRKVSTSGTISTVAGNGTGGFSGDGGTATAAMLRYPYGVTIGTAGNLYIADYNNNRIRKVNASRIITTVAGTGVAGYSGDGGPATAAKISYPISVAVDSSGNLFLADSSNSRIRKINTGGTITTYAGNGIWGSSGDNGPATAAELSFPTGVAVDTMSNLYITDYYNNSIRRVLAVPTYTISASFTVGNGSITPATSTVISGGNVTLTITPADGYYLAVLGDNGLNVRDRVSGVNPLTYTINPVIANHTVIAGFYPLPPVNGVCGSSNGGAFTAIPTANLCATGTASNVTGNGPWSWTCSGIYGGTTATCSANIQTFTITFVAGPNGTLTGTTPQTVNFGGSTTPIIAVPATGYHFVNWTGTGNFVATTSNPLTISNVQENMTITANFVIDGCMGTDNIITTIAGNGIFGYSGDGGPATEAALNYPESIVFDSAGNMFIADEYNHLIRKVATNGTITTIAGTGIWGFSGDGGPAISAQFNHPTGMAIDNSGNLFVADDYNHRIRKISANGTITTVAGNGMGGFSGDGGLATAAELYNPNDVAVDSIGNLFIADSYNSRIRKVDTSGIITTLAGTGTAGFSGDNGPAIEAMLNSPTGITIDSTGNLLIADYHNDRIRRIDASGTITTVAGTGTPGFSGDGGPAMGAQLYNPYNVTVDSIGNLLISDLRNHRVRKVDTNGTITTFAGTGTVGFSGDGGAATAAALNYPIDVAIDNSGNLYIADYGNSRIRKVLIPACPPAIDSYTKLLLHMDGENGSTTFTDSSPSAHTVTASGNAQISASYAVFGQGGSFDGQTNTYLSIPNSTDWVFGNGDFTIDGWIYLSGANQPYTCIIATTSGLDHTGWAINLNSTANKIRFVAGDIVSMAANWKVELTGTTTLSQSAWHHVAVTRSGNEFRLFLDGVQEATATSDVTIPDVGIPLRLANFVTYNAPLLGYMDEFRISKGIARWTSNFTPPTAPY